MFRLLPAPANLVRGGGTTGSNKPLACASNSSSPSSTSYSSKRPPAAPSRLSPSKMAAVQTLPKDVSKLGQDVKLFGKWDTQECVQFHPRLTFEELHPETMLVRTASMCTTSPSPTTSRSVTPSTSPTPLAVMPRSSSRRRRCPSLSDWLTGTHIPFLLRKEGQE